MKSIVEYLDYRVYMREFYEERKRTSAFTWREFSKLSGFSSSGYLKLVCDGKTRLRGAGAESVAKAMELTGYKAEYFCWLVKFCDSSKSEEKQKAYDEMQRIADVNKVRILGGDAYSYFSNWINPALRELAPLMPGAKLIDMARTLSPSVPAADVRYSLDQMVQMGLLRRIESDGCVTYEQADVGINPVSSPDQKAAVNVAMRNMQKQFAKLAADSVDDVDVSERSLSGMTVGIDRAAYERIEKEIAAFRKRIENIVSEVKEYDRVYRMNLHLFPLSRKLEEENENG
ncbi:MAG: TIGR02147 family protein [Fibrobacter sp.]|nr:TIGR02147 family protein [Fibrobacter sp.]